MSHDFSKHKAIPFAFGSLTGLRSFRVETNGSLNGVHFSQRYHGGENVAYCGAGLSSTTRVEGTWHHIAVSWCRCGIYAYYDGQDAYAQHHTVSGIVQGYGKCTYGRNGFRAEKMKLLAIINPHLSATQVKAQAEKDAVKIATNPPPKPNWRRRFYGSRMVDITIFMMVFIYIFLAITLGVYANSPVVVGPIILGLVITMLKAYQLMMNKQRWVMRARKIQAQLPARSWADPPFPVVTKADYTAIARAYPDVPQYRTTEEALKVFPLTDYWTETPGGRDRRKKGNTFI